MANGSVGSLLQRLRDALGPGDGGGLTDAQLLERFVRHRDEAAFETLVWRHALLVWNVCRRVLPRVPDVEDAFQATFLVLVRRAGTIARRESVAGWLYQVAYRVALRARSRAARRSAHEQPTDGLETAPAAADPGGGDLGPVLDAEIHALPRKYRVPFVLCYLEGKTNAEAAREIGCPPGTVASRLAWARGRLRTRLTRRGVAVPAGLLAAGLSAGPAPAAPPPAVATALRAAVRFAAGDKAPVPVSTLAEGVIRSMRMPRLILLAALGLVGLGLGAAAAGLPPARAPAVIPRGVRTSPATGASLRPDQAARDRRQLQGKWVPLSQTPNRSLADALPAATLTVTGGRMVLEMGGAKTEMTFRLDPGKRPSAVDLTPRDGPAKGKVIRGIYSLDGDFLELCFDSARPDHRPRAFVTAREVGARPVLVLRRAGKADLAKAESRYNLKVIALGLFYYQGDLGHFPPAADWKQRGDPLTSWRVLVLPYIEQDNLHSLYQRGKPWDGPDNRLVSSVVVRTFTTRPAGAGKPNVTVYQALTGPQTAIGAKKGARLADVTRGGANPVLVAEAAEPVPWSKPADLVYRPGKPLPALGGLFKDGFHMLLADGSVRFVKKGIGEKALRRLLLRGPETPQ